ncbi:MAG: hypothetical protein ACR2H4_05335 [Pyrinomonadaceae bacterium]
MKLGLNKFVNLYGEQTQDYSTYGQKQAFTYYVDCLRPENDKRKLASTDVSRKQVDEGANQTRRAWRCELE